MRVASDPYTAGRARHAARPRRHKKKRRVQLPTALLSAVALISIIGVAWKTLPRIMEQGALSTLRESLDVPAAEIVVIRRKATVAPEVSAAPPVPTPSPDPEMQQMLSRVDNLRALYEENNDLLGWLSIPDTRIDYPVMYTPDRAWHYLNRDFDGNSSKSGLPFLDESCKPHENTRNLLIYGHNMKDGSMFAGLHKLKSADYYTAHRTLYFLTPHAAARYEIVAVAPVEVTEDSPCKFYLYTDIADDAAFAEYARIIKEASLYPDDMHVAPNDELITLCTCCTHATPERLLVVAKRTT